MEANQVGISGYLPWGNSVPVDGDQFLRGLAVVPFSGIGTAAASDLPLHDLLPPQPLC